MNPLKVWRIAKREYLVNFRRKSFLFVAFGMPIFLVLVMVIVFAVISSNIEDISGYQKVGIVDLGKVFASAAGESSTALEKPFVLMESQAEAEKALQAREIQGYYVIPENFLSSGGVEAFYYQDKALNEGLLDALQEEIKGALSTQIGDPEVSKLLQNPVKEMQIYKVGVDEPLNEGAMMASFFVPSIVGSLIFILTMNSSQFLMSGLVEEKENRMMELFMTSSRPGEMLLGKLLGMGALSLSQLLIWGVFLLGYALFNNSVNVGQTLRSLQITPSFLAVTLVYTMLGYFLYGSFMAGIGATVNAEQEGRQWGSIISILGVIPFILFAVFITEPNGTVATLMSMIPLTAPTAMIIRVSFANVPPEQILLSMVILFLTACFVVYFSARVFRIGMLNYGKGGVLRVLRQAMFGRRSAPMVSRAEGVSA
ncbi:putative protein YhaP [Anaerolineae bacterium]|nr:putative protein YhaP [Anaerolineae bacterium]